MNPFVILSGAIVLLVVSGYAIAINTAINPFLFAWLWFNLWIAVYEIYIIYNKRKLSAAVCVDHRDFWTRDSSPTRFWKEAWNEYACVVDRRYLDPHDFVFIIEAINAILVIALLIAVYTGSKPVIIAAILLLQAYHCGIYFASWAASVDMPIELTFKPVIYLLISALWIFVPVYILLCNEYK